MLLRARKMDGGKFRRQHPIGPYIVDFCCIEHRIIVELDGGQHALYVEADQRRTDFLSKLGYRVLRIWNHEVLVAPVAVLERILDELHGPHPPLSLSGRGKRYTCPRSD
jgi:very-short-patch-repair endonuclease